MAIRPGGRALSSQIDSVSVTGFMGITNIASLADGTVKVSEVWSIRNGTVKTTVGTVKVSNIANGTVKVPEVWSLRNGTVKAQGIGGFMNLTDGTVKVSENWSLRNGTTKVSELWSLRNGTVKVPEVQSIRSGTVKIQSGTVKSQGLGGYLTSLTNGTVKTTVGTVKVSNLMSGTVNVPEVWSLRNGTVKSQGLGGYLTSLTNGTVKTSGTVKVFGTVKVSAISSGTVKVRGDYLTSITNATCKLPNGIPSGTLKVSELWSLRDGTVDAKGIGGFMNLAGGTVKVSENWSLRNGTAKVSELWSLRRGTVTPAGGYVTSLTNATVKQATRTNLLMKPEREDLLTEATQFTSATVDTVILAAVADQKHKIFACGYDISSNVRGRFRWGTTTYGWGAKRSGGVYAQTFPNPIVSPAVNQILNFRTEDTATCEVWIQYITEA